MKKVLFIFAMCVLAGCASKTDKAQNTAEQFLGAFLQNDHKTAASLCADELQQEFKKAISDFDKLQDPIKELIKEHCSQLKYEIVSVERINKSDTFNVNYNVLKSHPDSSALAKHQMFGSTLKVMDGKVIKLNK